MTSLRSTAWASNQSAVLLVFLPNMSISVLYTASMMFPGRYLVMVSLARLSPEQRQIPRHFSGCQSCFAWRLNTILVCCSLSVLSLILPVLNMPRYDPELWSALTLVLKSAKILRNQAYGCVEFIVKFVIALETASIASSGNLELSHLMHHNSHRGILHLYFKCDLAQIFNSKYISATTAFQSHFKQLYTDYVAKTLNPQNCFVL